MIFESKNCSTLIFILKTFLFLFVKTIFLNQYNIFVIVFIYWNVFQIIQHNNINIFIFYAFITI